MFRKFLKKNLFNLISRITTSYETQQSFNKSEVLKKSLKSSKDFFIEGHYKIVNPQYISFGNGFHSLWNLRIEAVDNYRGQQFFPEIVIGSNVQFHSDIHIGAINKVVIGNNVLLASRIYISDHVHGEINSNDLDKIPADRMITSKGPVIIEDNVWIGEGVSILAGVTIGKNAIVGANSVVNKSIPANCVAAGVPARVIKKLDN